MADAFTELQTQDSAKDLDHAEWLALELWSKVGDGVDQEGGISWG